MIVSELSGAISNNAISNRTAKGCETFLISFDIYQIESSSKIKETEVGSEQTKRFGAESWLCRWWSKGRASSLFDLGAQIPGVITNKFSTRNEVRKRERVNPKVRAKGVRTVDTRQTEDPWGQWGKRRKGESVERERKITLGFPSRRRKPDGWNQLKICDVFSIPSRDIRNYCLCFSPSAPYLSPMEPVQPPTPYLSNSSTQPPSFSSLNPVPWFPIPPTFCRLVPLGSSFDCPLLPRRSLSPRGWWKRLGVPLLKGCREFSEIEYPFSWLHLIYRATADATLSYVSIFAMGRTGSLHHEF